MDSRSNSSKSLYIKKKRRKGDRTYSKATLNSTKLNDPSSTIKAKEGSSRVTSSANEQRDDQDVSGPGEMEFENRQEKILSEVRVSGQPEVLIAHDSEDLLMPDRRSKSHNNQDGSPIG